MLNPHFLTNSAGKYNTVEVIGLSIDVFCRSYGLLERGKQMLGEAIYALYEEAGVFDACDYPDWRERVSDLSRNVTFTKVYKKMSDIDDNPAWDNQSKNKKRQC